MRRFSIKCAGVLKWVFENVRKRSRIFKNVQKYSTFLDADYAAKFSHRLPRLAQIFLDRTTGFTGICLSQLGVIGKHCFQSKLYRRDLPSSTRPSKGSFY